MIRIIAFVVFGLIFILAGCGDDEEPAKPTKVTVADLRQDGEFWQSLTPDLKDELASLCKRQVGDRRAESSGEPTVANRIESIPTAEVVTYVDKQYSNAAKMKSLISINCGGAIDEAIHREFNEAVGQLEG